MRMYWMIVLGCGLLLAGGAAFAADKEEKEDEQEQKVSLDKVPKAVIDAVKAKFPKGELKAAETGKDDGVTIYEVELKQGGKSIDVACKIDGTILEIEKEVAVADLPKAVTQAINGKYPNAKISEAEEVTELADDDDDEHEGKGEDGDKEKAKNDKAGRQDGDDEHEDEDEDDELVYEVEITTAQGKTLEVEVTPGGKILEAEADDDSEREDDDDK